MKTRFEDKMFSSMFQVELDALENSSVRPILESLGGLSKCVRNFEKEEVDLAALRLLGEAVL